MEFDTSDTVVEESEAPAQLDLAYLRDLLSLLREHKVQAFQVEGMGVTFVEESEEAVARSNLTPKQVEDENRSTSSTPVGGFKSPTLWPTTNGKRLNFRGELED